MQKRLIGQMAELLEQGNFTRVDPANVHFILTKDSAYGLDLQVDLDAFEEVLIYYRGATTISERRRDVKRAYMRWKEVRIPVFQRLCLLFKLKPFDVRVREVMQRAKDRAQGSGEDRAPPARPAAGDGEQRLHLYQAVQEHAAQRRGDDLPQHQGRFRLFDKIKFGVTAGSGVGMGVFGTVGKIALPAIPTRWPPPWPGSAAWRCARPPTSSISATATWWCWRKTSISTPWPTTAGVMTLLADRAAEEDIKEEMLLYSVLAKERVNIRDLRQVDAAIEEYLKDDLQHRRGLRCGRCVAAPEGRKASSRSCRTARSKPAAPRGRAAHRQALGCLPRQPARPSSSRRAGRRSDGDRASVR